MIWLLLYLIWTVVTEFMGKQPIMDLYNINMILLCSIRLHFVIKVITLTMVLKLTNVYKSLDRKFHSLFIGFYTYLSNMVPFIISVSVQIQGTHPRSPSQMLIPDFHMNTLSLSFNSANVCQFSLLFILQCYLQNFTLCVDEFVYASVWDHQEMAKDHDHYQPSTGRQDTQD